MSAGLPRLLIVTGLQREAAIAAGQGSFTVCSGGSPGLLRERLTALGDTAKIKTLASESSTSDFDVDY